MSPSEIADLIEAKRPRVLVVGDVMLDEYVYGTVTHRSPEADVPVVEVTALATLPGGAANVAWNVAVMGGRPDVATVTGCDEAAGRFTELCHSFGASRRVVGDAGRRTTTKYRLVADGRQLCRYDVEVTWAISELLEKELLSMASRSLRDAGAVVLSDYAKGVCTPKVCRGVIGMARDARIPVVVDPKGPDATKYRGATVVKPNTKEAELLRARNHCADLRAAFPGSSVVVTADGKGMWLFPRTGNPSHIAAVLVPQGIPIDPTGAGDTVAAGLALALAVGADVESAARFANLCAGLVVRKPGTATVTPDEVRAHCT
jgi:rfaE bifunctional protein kinase chain/domain